MQESPKVDTGIVSVSETKKAPSSGGNLEADSAMGLGSLANPLNLQLSASKHNFRENGAVTDGQGSPRISRKPMKPRIGLSTFSRIQGTSDAEDSKDSRKLAAAQVTQN